MKSDSPQTLDDYIASFPPPVRSSLEALRNLIREEAPGALETLKYRMPTFVLGENLVHFAAFERHIGFYPTPSAITAFAKDLKNYVSAKGSVQFPLDQPLPMTLIRRMVQFRVKEVRGKGTRRGGGK